MVLQMNTYKYHHKIINNRITFMLHTNNVKVE